MYTYENVVLQSASVGRKFRCNAIGNLISKWEGAQVMGDTGKKDKGKKEQQKKAKNTPKEKRKIKKDKKNNK